MTEMNIFASTASRRWAVSALSLSLLASTAVSAFGQAASGNIFNEATVNGTFGPSATPLYPSGSPLPTDNATVPLVSPTPQYVATKTVIDPAAAVAGNQMTYTITVQNTGNVSLTLDVADISDAGPTFGTTGPNALNAAFAFDSTRDTNADLVGDGGDLDGDGNIDPGETLYYTATYTLTQADIDAAAGITDGVSNTVSLVVEDPTGTPAPVDTVTPSDLVAEATIDLDADLGFAKVAYDAAYPGGSVITGPVTAGQTIYYRFTVTNSSNVTVGDVAINDPGALINGSTTPVAFTTGPTQVEGGDTTLAPTELAVFEATYVVTQSDIDGQ